MTAYIRRMSDFRTAAKADVISYTDPTESEANTAGTVVLVGLIDGYTGDWLYLDGHLYVITGCTQDTPAEGQTSIKISNAANAFARSMVYASGNYASTGAYIAGILNSDFVSCSDVAYRLPYMSVSNLDTTAFSPPETDNDGIFDFVDYVLAARKKGVWLRFDVSGNTLSVTVSHRTRAEHPVYLGDGHSQLEKQQYTYAAVAKVTVRRAAEEGGAHTVSTYYLAANGNVSASVPSQRARGEWRTISIAHDADPLAEATKVFEDNAGDHQITLYSDRDYTLYDRLTIFFPKEGKTVKTNITTVQRQSTDGRRYYKCGTLATTLTEQIRSLRGKG